MLCSAAGPFYWIVASTTRQNDDRYEWVGPIVGSVCWTIWVLFVLLTPGVRRAQSLYHVLGAMLWFFCGVMLLIATGGK